MNDDDVVVEVPGRRGWKQAIRQPKVWIPAAATIAVGAVVGALVATADGTDPAASTSPSASPSPTESVAASPSTSPSASSSPATSATAPASPSPGPSESESGEGLWLQVHGFGGGREIGSFTWSPDSRHLAFTLEVGEAPGYENVGIIDSDTGNEVFMESCGYPITWAHAHNRLAVMGCRAEAGVLRIVDEHANTKQRIELSGVEKVYSLGWSRDDKAVIFASGPSWHANGAKVVSVNVATGKQTVLDEGGLLTVSPAGDRIAYWADEDGDGSATALVASRSDGSDRMVLVAEDDGAAGNLGLAPVWAPDGSAVAYRYDNADGSAEWSVYEFSSGSAHGILTSTKPAGYGQIRWAPEGDKLFVSSAKTGWAVTRDGDVLGKETFAEQMYPTTAWSADGQSIGVEYAGHDAELWHVTEGVIEPVPGADGYDPQTPYLWSSDGTRYTWTGTTGDDLTEYLIVGAPQ